MAKWKYRKPILQMKFEELADELVAIVDYSENGDVDVEAIEQILNVIDEKYPLDVKFKSVEESWAEFCEYYMNTSEDDDTVE